MRKHDANIVSCFIFHYGVYSIKLYTFQYYSLNHSKPECLYFADLYCELLHFKDYLRILEAVKDLVVSISLFSSILVIFIPNERTNQGSAVFISILVTPQLFKKGKGEHCNVMVENILYCMKKHERKSRMYQWRLLVLNTKSLSLAWRTQIFFVQHKQASNLQRLPHPPQNYKSEKANIIYAIVL